MRRICSSKPARGKYFVSPYLEKTHAKQGWWSSSNEALNSNLNTSPKYEILKGSKRRKKWSVCGKCK
jgi:hypothetical protein